MTETISKNKQPLIAAILIIYLIRPYFTWSGFLSTTYAIYFATVLLGFLFLSNIDLSKGKLLIFAFMAITLGYAVGNGYNLLFTVTFIPLVFIPFAKLEFYKETYRQFLNVLAILLGISLFIWILVQIRVLGPLGTISPLNKAKQYDYYVYPLLVAAGDTFRFCGLFDEPGVVGTLMGIILCIQKFDFNDRKNLLFLACGIASLSMFFYGLVFVYYLYYYAFYKRQIKKLSLFLIISVAIFVAITQIPALYEVLGSRFEWNADSNTFMGNNRSGTLMTEYFDSIIGTDVFWYGLDPNMREDFSEQFGGEASYMTSIIYNGVILFGSYVAFFIFFGWKNRQNINSFLLFALVFIATIYQRPFLYHTEYIFLWSSMALFQKEKVLIRNR